MSFRRGSSHTNSTQQAEAQLFNTYAREWNAWKLLVQVMKSRLNENAIADDFDELVAGTAQQKTKDLEREWATIERSLRERLQQIYEDRRAAYFKRVADEVKQSGKTPGLRDEVEAQLLNRIDQELQGHADPRTNGQAQYLRPNAQDLEDFWVFDHHAVKDVSGHDFALVRKRRARSRTIIPVVLGLVILLVVGGLLVRSNATATEPAPSAAVLVGNTTHTLWSMNTMSIGPDVWDIDFFSAGIPAQVCIETDKIALFQINEGVTITGTEGVRLYTIIEDGLQPDLIIKNCDTDPPTTIALAQITSVVVVDDATDTPVAIQAYTSDVDPETIPADRMLVELTWKTPTYGDARIVLADGSSIAPLAVIEEAEDEIRTQYLLPTVPYDQELGLTRSIVGSIPQHQVITVPAPMDRMTFLRKHLRVELKTTRWEVNEYGTPQIMVDVDIQIAPDTVSQIDLRQSDLSLIQNRQQRTVEWSPVELSSGTTTISIALAVEVNTSNAELIIFGWPFRLEW